MNEKPAETRKSPNLIRIELDMSTSDPGLEQLQPGRPHLEAAEAGVARWRIVAVVGTLFGLILGILVGRLLMP